MTLQTRQSFELIIRQAFKNLRIAQFIILVLPIDHLATALRQFIPFSGGAFRFPSKYQNTLIRFQDQLTVGDQLLRLVLRLNLRETIIKSVVTVDENRNDHQGKGGEHITKNEDAVALFVADVHRANYQKNRRVDIQKYLKIEVAHRDRDHEFGCVNEAVHEKLTGVRASALLQHLGGLCCIFQVKAVFPKA